MILPNIARTLAPSLETSLTTPQRIMRMACAFYESGVLFAASDAGVFAALASGPACADELACSLRCDPRGLTLLLDACVAVGLLTKSAERYANTAEAAAFLVPGCPGDLSGALRYNRDVYPAWGRLLKLVRTGEPVEPAETHLGEDAERTRVFVTAMHERALGMGRMALEQMDLTGRRRLLDVGGGAGTYAGLIARAWPDIECTVLDLPAVVRHATELLARDGLSSRVRFLAGDYHVSDFPDGMEVVNFFGVLHQESADAIRALLKRAYRCLAPGGLIQVMDLMTDASHTQPRFSALFAVNMALTTRCGWVYSDRELQGWLAEAGFQQFRLRRLEPAMPHWLVTAIKPVTGA